MDGNYQAIKYKVGAKSWLTDMCKYKEVTLCHVVGLKSI